jgi:hypothetical protein
MKWNVRPLPLALGMRSGENFGSGLPSASVNGDRPEDRQEDGMDRDWSFPASWSGAPSTSLSLQSSLPWLLDASVLSLSVSWTSVERAERSERW